MKETLMDSLAEWIDDGRGARLIVKEGKHKSFTLLGIRFKPTTKRYECTVKMFETETTIYNKSKTRLKHEIIKILGTAPIDYLTGRIDI